jgi:RNA polymerase sigma factor (sigma-70 family)
LRTNNYSTEKVQEIHLWQAYKLGCSDSLGAITRLHYANLLRYGMALGFDREEVKDAIQNTFVYLWEHHETLGDVENGKAYLFFALRNRLMREQKQTKHEQTFWQRLLATQDVQQSMDVDWMNAEIEVENHQNIRQIIADMSPREREVIQLRFYEGLDNQAIAEIMGITKQGVANLLVRTLKNFRVVWAELITILFLVFIRY